MTKDIGAVNNTSAREEGTKTIEDLKKTTGSYGGRKHKAIQWKNIFRRIFPKNLLNSKDLEVGFRTDNT